MRYVQVHDRRTLEQRKRGREEKETKKVYTEKRTVFVVCKSRAFGVCVCECGVCTINKKDWKGR